MTLKIQFDCTEDRDGRAIANIRPVLSFGPDDCATGSISFAVFQAYMEDPQDLAAQTERAKGNARDVMRRIGGNIARAAEAV